MKDFKNILGTASLNISDFYIVPDLTTARRLAEKNK